MTTDLVPFAYTSLSNAYTSLSNTSGMVPAASLSTFEASIIDSIVADLLQPYKKDKRKSICCTFELGARMMARVPLAKLGARVLVVSDLILLMCLVNHRSAHGLGLTDVVFAANTHEQAALGRILGAQVLMIGYNDPTKRYAYKEKKQMSDKLGHNEAKDQVEAILALRARSFDVVLANPPYKQGKHLQFFKLGLDVLDENGHLVIVHPAEWLVHRRATKNGLKHANLRSRLRDKHVNAEFIMNPWRGESNGKDKAKRVSLYVPLVVTHVSSGANCAFTDSRTTGYGRVALTPQPTVQLDSLDLVSQWSSPHLDPHDELSLVKKVKALPSCKSRIKKAVGTWYVSLDIFGGNGETTVEYYDGVTRCIPNMYSIVNSTSLKVFNAPLVAKGQRGKEEGNEKLWFSFTTEIEAQNFLGFITKNKHFRSYLAIIKIDQRADPASIPWLDWTVEWTDDKFAALAQFTPGELNTSNHIIDTITLPARAKKPKK